MSYSLPAVGGEAFRSLDALAIYDTDKKEKDKIELRALINFLLNFRYRAPVPIDKEEKEKSNPVCKDGREMLVRTEDSGRRTRSLRFREKYELDSTSVGHPAKE